jgi:hypothetical protein
MRKCCDVIVAERRDTVPGRRRLRVPMSLHRMFFGLPLMLMSRKVFLLPLLLGDPMRMRRAVPQFAGALMVFVM